MYISPTVLFPNVLHHDPLLRVCTVVSPCAFDSCVSLLASVLCSRFPPALSHATHWSRNIERLNRGFRKMNHGRSALPYRGLATGTPYVMQGVAPTYRCSLFFTIHHVRWPLHIHLTVQLRVHIQRRSRILQT
jgi:hypothetical protein